MTAIATNFFPFSRDGSNQLTPGSSQSAILLAERAAQIASHFRSSEYNSDAASKIITNLFTLYDSTKTADWDGYGAKPITLEILNKAWKFAESLDPALPLPELSPEPDGEIALEWYGANESVFSISIGETNVLSFSAIFPDRNSLRGTESYAEKPANLLESFIWRVLAEKK